MHARRRELEQRQRRQAQPPQHALLAPGDEREGHAEGRALGDRHRQDPGHEQVDVVERLGLDRLGDEPDHRLGVHGAQVELSTMPRTTPITIGASTVEVAA